MDLSDTREEAAFRTKARQWLAENAPKSIADRGFALAIDEIGRASWRERV